MINNILVMKIDVGQLPPMNAEAFVERIKEQMNKDGVLDELKEQGTYFMFLPVRPNSQTSVELIPIPAGPKQVAEKMSREKIAKLEDLKLQVMAQNPQLLGIYHDDGAATYKMQEGA